MAYAAVGKFIYHRSAYPLSQEVVDDSTEVGTYGGAHDDHNKAHFAKLGCRGYYNFRWKGYERTLNSHQQNDGPLVKVFYTPLYKG